MEQRSYELTLAICDLRRRRAGGRQSREHNAAPRIMFKKILENPDCRTLRPKSFSDVAQLRADIIRVHQRTCDKQTFDGYSW
jgi:hypothetical protein